MYSIQIANPYLAELARSIFREQPVTEDADLQRFLQEQKLKLDVAQSQQELESGEIMQVQEAFDSVYRQLKL